MTAFQQGAARPIQAALNFLMTRIPALLRGLARRRLLSCVLVICLALAAFWGLIASDRYVSEAHVLIQRTDLSSGQTMDFGALLTGVSGGNRNDQLLLRDYLLSADMMRRLDEKLGLRAHYSSSQWDVFTRLWDKDVPAEKFQRYLQSRISVTYDEYNGVLVIQAQAYEPKMAQAIAMQMVQDGETYMNAMAHALASGQVAFLENQVAKLGQDAQQERQKLLAMQNEKGLVSPQATAESMVGVVAKLEASLTELRTRRSALAGYLTPTAPSIVETDLQIAALQKQIAEEQARLASPHGDTLNKTVEEFQRQQMAAQFAMDVYKTALVALERGRVEATRALKKVSIIQNASLPEYPLLPRRLYNIVVSILMTALLAGILVLIMAIVRDHRE
jgi:capsular polysaccharide transport system permease protein